MAHHEFAALRERYFQLHKQDVISSSTPLIDTELPYFKMARRGLLLGAPPMVSGYHNRDAISRMDKKLLSPMYRNGTMDIASRLGLQPYTLTSANYLSGKNNPFLSSYESPSGTSSMYTSPNATQRMGIEYLI